MFVYIYIFIHIVYTYIYIYIYINRYIDRCTQQSTVETLVGERESVSVNEIYYTI